MKPHETQLPTLLANLTYFPSNRQSRPNPHHFLNTARVSEHSFHFLPSPPNSTPLTPPFTPTLSTRPPSFTTRTNTRTARWDGLEGSGGTARLRRQEAALPAPPHLAAAAQHHRWEGRHGARAAGRPWPQKVAGSVATRRVEAWAGGSGRVFMEKNGARWCGFGIVCLVGRIHSAKDVGFGAQALLTWQIRFYLANTLHNLSS